MTDYKELKNKKNEIILNLDKAKLERYILSLAHKYYGYLFEKDSEGLKYVIESMKDIVSIYEMKYNHISEYIDYCLLIKGNEVFEAVFELDCSLWTPNEKSLEAMGGLKTLSYSLDDGETWTTTTISGTVTFGTINTGQKIIFKGTNARFAIAYDNYNFFDATKQFKVYGNIMSLFNGDDFKENSEFDSSTTHHCAGLLRSTYLVDASNLILPSLTIYSSSYNGMFRGDTALQYGPQMLATTPISTGTEHCSSMFEGCINLEEAIDINFTTLAKQCCFRMFLMHRTSKITTPKMTKSPILRCATGVSGCYDEMFKGNGNLVEVTCLLANDSAATNNWLVNVSSAGTFYKSSLKTNWPTNASGVPSGWTIVDYTE